MAKVTITEKRDFAGGDASMLTACAVIMGAAIAQKAFLFSKRSNWNDAFFKSIIDSIKDAFKNILGIDGLGDQTKASKALYKAMEEVVPKLRSFKNAVEIDFTDDNREQEILNSLGFKLWRKVDKNNQEALVELLATFTSNMTPALKKEITDEGTDASYITDIISYADVIRDKNIAQEGKKVDKKTVTNDGIIKLNKIYNDVMKVAKHSANLYNEAKDPVSADKFNYSKVLATLTNNAKGGGGKGGATEAGK